MPVSFPPSVLPGEVVAGIPTIMTDPWLRPVVPVHVLDRISQADFTLWERQLARCNWCAHPIRLRGTVEHVDRTTGEAAVVYDTDEEPYGVLLKACGNRRAAVCPGCAEVKRADTYQL